MRTFIKDESTAALRDLFIEMVSNTDYVTRITGLSLTYADIAMCKAGGSAFATVNSSVTVTEIGSGTYRVRLTAADLDTEGMAQIRVIKSGCVTQKIPIVVTAGVTVQTIRDDVIDADAIAADAIGADQLAAGAIAKIWAALTSGLTAVGSVGKFLVDEIGNLLTRLGTCSGASNNTIVGYLKALASTAAGKPTDFGTFDGNTDSLEAVGQQAAGIGYGGSGDTLHHKVDDANAALSNLDTDIHACEIAYCVDEVNSRDEYTALWYLNGVPLEAGSISSMSIAVYDRATGAALLGPTAMTKIGSTATWKYDASGAERLGSGEAAVAVIEVTGPWGSAEFRRLIFRDSEGA